MTLSDHARRLNRASGRTDLPPAILMTDERRLPDPSGPARDLPQGAAILIRQSDADARRALALKLFALCRDRGLRLVVSDDIVLAEQIGAAGLHLPERAAATAEAMTLRRRWRGLLTVAAHSPDALRRAAVIGADAALVSPVFATASHPAGRPIGVLRFLAWCRAARVPIYALGGVRAQNAGRLAGRAIVGIAGISGFHRF